MTDDYTTYGDEWIDEIMQLRKSDIINVLRSTFIESDKLKAALLEIQAWLKRSYPDHYESLTGYIIATEALNEHETPSA